jgi:hypothetical protein
LVLDHSSLTLALGVVVRQPSVVEWARAMGVAPDELWRVLKAGWRSQNLLFKALSGLLLKLSWKYRSTQGGALEIDDLLAEGTHFTHLSAGPGGVGACPSVGEMHERSNTLVPMS